MSEDVVKALEFGYKTSKKAIDTVEHLNDSVKGREKYAKNIQHKYGNLTLSGLNYQDKILLQELFIDLDVYEGFSFDLDSDRQPESDNLSSDSDNLSSDSDNLSSDSDRQPESDNLSSDSDNLSSDSDNLSIEKKKKFSELVPKILSNKEYRCVVILGPPGSGKSTLAERLALKWANEQSSENWIQSVLEEHSPGDFLKSKNGRFPLLIDLEEYSKSKFFSEGFLKFWQHGSGRNWQHKFDTIEKSLKNSTRLVIFEGLDRVIPLNYLDVLNKIVEFSESYLGAKIIVTSRSVGYNPDRLENSEFKHFTIQDLDEAQIEGFVDKFSKILTIESMGKGKNSQKKKRRNNQIDPNRKIDNKERIISAIYKSSGGKDLATNPSMLMMMAMILRHQDTFALPSDEELYYIASEFRLRNHINTRNSVEGIDIQEQQEILGKIAYEIQFGCEAASGDSIDDESLKNILTEYLASKRFKEPRESSVQILEQLKSDNYIFCNNANFQNKLNYSFVHRRVLAYFCAMETKRKLNKKYWRSMKQLSQDTFDLYWQDESRQKSLQSICSVLDPTYSIELVGFLMNKKVERADYLDDTNRATKAAFQHLHLAQQCLRTISNQQSIGSISDELKKKLKSEIDKPGISLSPDAAKLLTNLVTEHYVNDIETLRWLQDIAVKDGDKIVRSSALQSISEYYHKKSSTLAYLKDRAEEDLDEFVRRSIVRSVSVYYHKSPDLLTWLKNRAVSDLNELVRREAVRSIAQYYANSPDTMSWLRDRAIHEHESVRAQAVQSIAQYYGTEPNILAWLQGRIRNDEHPLVRSTAVRSIATHYHQQLGTLKYLKSVAKNSAYVDVRRVAIASISKYYASKNTFTLLQSISQQDPDATVRAAAVRSTISKHYPSPDPLKSLAWLQDRALNDKDQQVRQTAVQSIAQYYHQEPDTLKWLKTCVVDNPDQEAKRQYLQKCGHQVEHLPAINPQHKHKSIRVQKIAVASIAKYYHTDPQILEWLQSVSVEPNVHENVRVTAVESIALYYHDRLVDILGWQQQNNSVYERTTGIKSIAKYFARPNNPDMIQWLKKYAAPNEPENVRSTAIESIALYDSPNIDTLNWLKQVALNQGKSNPREKAVALIAKYYYRDGGTLEWLKEQANNKQNVLVVAVKSIAAYYYTDPNTLEWLKKWINDNKPNVRVAVVESIAAYYYTDPNTLEWLKKSANDQDKGVRFAVARSIAKYYYKDRLAVKWLKEFALKYPDIGQEKFVKESIVRYHRETEPLESLKERALNDRDSEERRASVKLIAQHYRKEADALAWLKQIALGGSQDRDVRLAAVESIGKYQDYRKQPETLKWFKTCAVSADRADVRQMAVESIARYYNQHEPNTLTWLQEFVLNSSDKVMLPAVLNSIAKYYQNSSTIIWLKDRATDSRDLLNVIVNPNHVDVLKQNMLKDPDPLKQWSALQSLVKYYHKNPTILTWLQDRCLYDEDPNMRVLIVESIAKYYHKKSFIFNWLKECAFTDHQPLVRSAAIRSIDKYFPESQEISTLLNQIVARDPDLDCSDEAYPKAVALKILKNKYKYPQN